MVRFIPVQEMTDLSTVIVAGYHRAPAVHVVVVEQVARLGREPRGAQHGGNVAIGRALRQIADEGAAVQRPCTMNLSMPG